MILGIVAKRAIYEQIATLNFRGNYDIRHIDTKSLSAAQKKLEGEQVCTDILIDLDGFGVSADEVVALVGRLLTTTQLHIMVLADGFVPGSRLVRDLEALGLAEQDIFLQAGTHLKMGVSKLLNGTRPKPAALPRADAAEKTPSEPPMEQPVKEQVAAAWPVLPPSQIDVVSGKAKQIRKPPRPATRAVTVAVAGAGPRIGTTTQAMQLLHYLRALSYKAVVVDMQSSGQLEQYLDVYAGQAEVLNPHEFVIQGCRLLTTGKVLMQARAEYDYVICDYGPYDEIAETVSFWEKDIKILVAGVKPWESAFLPQVFEDDDGSLNYVFSFVAQADEADVLQQMDSSAASTYFAPYAPDYFTYCGADEFYARLLNCENEKPAQKKASFLFKRFGRQRK